MAIYDYYEREKYWRINFDCSKELSTRVSVNNIIDGFIALLDLNMNDEEFRELFPIDKNGCLFYLLCKYATSKENRKKLINIPQIDSFEKQENVNYIHGVLGDATFELYLNNILDIILKYIETDVSKIQVLYELYKGNLYGYCHYSAAELGRYYDIISAFIPAKFDNCRFLHSYLERDNTIYDVSNNLVMSKDDYYSLLTPEEVMKMSGEQLYGLYEKENNKTIEQVYLDRVYKVLKKKKTLF